MNKSSAVSSLATINGLVYSSTHKELRGKNFYALKAAVADMMVAVVGDSYGVKWASRIDDLVRIGFAGSDPSPGETRQEIMAATEKLMRYFDENPDSN